MNNIISNLSNLKKNIIILGKEKEFYKRKLRKIYESIGTKYINQDIFLCITFLLSIKSQNKQNLTEDEIKTSIKEKVELSEIDLDLLFEITKMKEYLSHDNFIENQTPGQQNRL